MWIDETDTTQLSQRLRVGPRELIQTIGGPWRIAWRIAERESEQPGTLFVGRAGPAVAILVGDGPEPTVVVGMAAGQWQDVTTLQWTLVDPTGSFVTPPPTAASMLVDGFLQELGASVDEAYSAAEPALVTCRYCGVLVAPAHAVGEEMCSTCGTTIFGIAF